MDQFCYCVTFFIVIASVVDVVIGWPLGHFFQSRDKNERERNSFKKSFVKKSCIEFFFLLLHLLQLQRRYNNNKKLLLPSLFTNAPLFNMETVSLSQSFSLTFSAEGVVREEFFHPALNFHSSSSVKSSSVGIDCHQKWHQTPLSLFALWWLQIF